MPFFIIIISYHCYGNEYKKSVSLSVWQNVCMPSAPSLHRGNKIQASSRKLVTRALEARRKFWFLRWHSIRKRSSRSVYLFPNNVQSVCLLETAGKAEVSFFLGVPWEYFLVNFMTKGPTLMQRLFVVPSWNPWRAIQKRRSGLVIQESSSRIELSAWHQAPYTMQVLQLLTSCRQDTATHMHRLPDFG